MESDSAESSRAGVRADGRRLASLPHCVLQRVFHRLSPKDLCRVSAVCRLWRQLNRDVVGERRWQRHYVSRWPVHDPAPSRLWAELYADRVRQSSAFGGRFFHDGLLGHRAGVRSLQLLPQENLLATGSLDKTVRLWDLEQGMPLCASASHEGTVRTLVLHQSVFQKRLRLMSGSDVTIRIWSLPTGDAAPHLQNPVKLKGHTGPISNLTATEELLCSGAWDCSVCVWREGLEWQLVSRYVYSDWIWAVHAKERRFAVCSGRRVHVQDFETEARIQRLPEFLSEGHVTSCQMTQDEWLLVTGATDGVARLHDLRCRKQVMEVASHGSGVTSVAFEDPWVASGSLDGTISLINLHDRLHPELQKSSQLPCRRQLQCQSGPVYCLDMSNQWIACGAEQSTVRTWDFTRALAAAKKAEIARSIRRNRKNRPLSFAVKPVQEEPSEDSVSSAHEGEESCGSEDEKTPSPSQIAPCRSEHRHGRRGNFWKSLGWGDSTDDSEIIDAFG